MNGSFCPHKQAVRVVKGKAFFPLFQSKFFLLINLFFPKKNLFL